MATGTIEAASKLKKRARIRRKGTIREICLVKNSPSVLPAGRSVGDQVEMGGRCYQVAFMEGNARSSSYVHLCPVLG